MTRKVSTLWVVISMGSGGRRVFPPGRRALGWGEGGPKSTPRCRDVTGMQDPEESVIVMAYTMKDRD